MSVLNNIVCNSNTSNVGVCDCFFDPKEIIGFILVPKGTSFSDSQLADGFIATNLHNLVNAPAKADRGFPVTVLVGLTDSSEEPVTQTFGYGKSETVREGIIKWLFMFRKGGVNLSNSLRSFNGKQAKYEIMLIDASNTLIGTKVLNASQVVALGGIPLDRLYTNPWKVNDGANLAAFRTNVEFEPVYINENLAFRTIDPAVLLLRSLEGLIDIDVTSGASATSTTATVKLMSGCGEDLYDEYADEFANAGSGTAGLAFNNFLTGLAITFTSIVKNDTLKAWVVTFPTSSNPNYPAAGGKYIISVVGLTDLTSIGVVGYEGRGTLTITRP